MGKSVWRLKRCWVSDYLLPMQEFFNQVKDDNIAQDSFRTNWKERIACSVTWWKWVLPKTVYYLQAMKIMMSCPHGNLPCCCQECWWWILGSRSGQDLLKVRKIHWQRLLHHGRGLPQHPVTAHQPPLKDFLQENDQDQPELHQLQPNDTHLLHQQPLRCFVIDMSGRTWKTFQPVSLPYTSSKS